MTNLLIYVAIATIFVLIIILAKQFKDKKKILETSLLRGKHTIELELQLSDAKSVTELQQKEVKDLSLLNEQKITEIDKLESLCDKQGKKISELSLKHTEYLETITQLAQENATLKEQIDNLTKQIIQPRIETKAKKQRNK